MQKDEALIVRGKAPFTVKQLPGTNFAHIESLTDNTGIIRYALPASPDGKEGYFIDDNSRALLLAVWAGKNGKNKAVMGQRLLPIYLSFIHSMQMQDGYFRNFLSYDRTGTEERSSEDAFGRTLMALGFLVNEGPTHLLVRTGLGVFVKAYEHISKLSSLRAIANALIGICQVIKYNYPDDGRQDMVIHLSDKLTEIYRSNRRDDWHWFEPTLTCDNAILPLALLNAYEITQHDEYMEVAFESMHFLESKVLYNGVLQPIGNQGWDRQGMDDQRKDGQGRGKQGMDDQRMDDRGRGNQGQRPAGIDQRCIDVMAMVLFYQQAYRITREQPYLDRMYQSYQWFLGINDLGMSLYDPSTGGCADGFRAKGSHFSQGAESTLAYWISHVTVSTALAE